MVSGLNWLLAEALPLAASCSSPHWILSVSCLQMGSEWTPPSRARSEPIWVSLGLETVEVMKASMVEHLAPLCEQLDKHDITVYSGDEGT